MGGLRAPCVTWGQEAAAHWGSLGLGTQGIERGLRATGASAHVPLLSPVLCLEL